MSPVCCLLPARMCLHGPESASPTTTSFIEWLYGLKVQIHMVFGLEEKKKYILEN